jgi:hypothetical protein
MTELIEGRLWIRRIGIQVTKNYGRNVRIPLYPKLLWG